jgi:energy-coupling factor transporter transmembrane protein EcfT
MNDMTGNGMTLPEIDPRIKLAATILISLACASARFPGLILFSSLLIFLIIYHGPPYTLHIHRLIPFFLILCGLFLTRAITVNDIGGGAWIDVTLTADSVKNGLLICWRLIVVTLAGIMFISTTPMFQIKAGIEWFLMPVPLVSEQHISTLISLMVRFLPVILEETQKVRDAQQARCIHARKNPAARVMHLAVPVLQRAILTADRLTDAMQSRCYTENRTRYALRATRTDWMALGIILGICFLSILV